jgi:hypothetical protein
MRLQGPVKARFHSLVRKVDGTVNSGGMDAVAQCPACDRSGLHISYETDGGIAMYCHSTEDCGTEAVLEVLRIPMADLAPDRRNGTRATRPVTAEAIARAEAVEGDARVHRPSFVHMTGYLPAALMLQQLLFWESEPGGVFKVGQWWTAKPYEEWGRELGISHHEAMQARTCLRTSA